MIAAATLDADALLDGFAAIADRYDCVLLDVWGVLIGDGCAYDAAAACLEALARECLPTVLVSNTSRRSDALQDMLAGLGIARARYHDSVTAGDVAFDLVIRRDRALKGARRCLVVGDQPGGHWAAAAGLDVTEDPRAADFVLAVGVLPTGWQSGACGAAIDRALGCDLPFLITNPDRRVLIDGQLHEGVGVLTDWLRPFGATVIETGKPHAAIFENALHRAARGRGTVPSTPVMIGDSHDTDIAGATRFGIDSVLIGGAASGGVDAATWRMEALRW